MMNAIASYHAAASTGVIGTDRPDTRQPRREASFEKSSNGSLGLPDRSGSRPDVQLGLSDEAQRVLDSLRQRDREVRSHEQAHISAGGEHVRGGASFSTVRGPDNQQYANAGEVQIDTAPVPGNPDKTLEKAQKIRQAALAPASPSAQDQQVAAEAAQLQAQARMEKASAAYKRMGGETGLALWGTGFSLSV